MDFLTDNEVEFDLPALKATSTRSGVAPPSGAARARVRADRRRPVRPDGRRGRARTSDHRGHQFLQWFIEEQVEEEAKLQKIVDLVDSGINLFQAEALLGSFEQRSRRPPASRPGPPALTRTCSLGTVSGHA